MNNTKDYIGFIWIGITRTGSGSMMSLLKKGGRNLTAKQIREHTTKEAWDQAFKFSFVRHPIDRFISAYTSQGYHLDSRTSVKKAIESKHLIFKPQVDFLTEKVDFIGRYENLDNDWKKVAKLVGVSEELPHMNESPYKGTWHPSIEEEKLIREFYKEDFKRFNYV